MNENAPHKIHRGWHWRCGPDGVDVAFLEEVRHWREGVGFEVSDT